MAPPSVSPTLARELVLSLLPPLRQDPTVLKQVTDHIAKEVKADVQGSSRMTWEEVGSNIAGLARTARVRVQSDLADALDKSVSELDGRRRAGHSVWEGDMPIKMSNLSQHVQFLLAMACQPTIKTHDLAHEYLHRQPPVVVDEERRLYDEIMQAPFEGDHWQERYESEVEGWSDSDDDRISSDSGGPDEAIVTPHRERPVASLQYLDKTNVEEEARDRRAQDAERALVELGKGAYWNTGGEVVQKPEVKDGWRSVSTSMGVASLSLALREDAQGGTKAITGIQFQRELLFALSDRRGVMLDFTSDAECFIISDHPTVLHYSPEAVESLLSTLQHRAGQASAIRRLIRETLSPIGSSTSQPPSRTTQAFAEACRCYMGTMDDWISNLELAIIRGSHESKATTPLSLRLDLDTKFGNMLDHLSSVLPYTHEPIILLNALYAILQTLSTGRQALLDIFITSATPLWETLGDWLIRGMPIPRSLIDVESRSDAERSLDREFWVDRDWDVSWTDEDLWDAAFILKNDRPDWIDDELLEATLEAGKARGLLRGLLGYELDPADNEDRVSLSDLLRGGEHAENTSQSVASYLSPRCHMTTFHLRRVLDQDCGLQAHLQAIDGVFYHQGIDSLQSWQEWLFSQVIARKQWSDFQILTSTLRENIEKRGEGWLNPPAIRVDPGSRRSTTTNMISPDMFSTLRPSYRIPFPLSQLFTSTSLDLRGDVFTFLLQVQFGRYLLSRTRLLESRTRDGTSSLLRLRHKLAFIINTIHTWITERVIQLETERYKLRVDETTSFGAMIQLELHHVRRIRVFSFQHAKTSAINECVMGILEMTADLYDLFYTLNFESQTQIPTPTQVDEGETRPITPKDQHVQGRSRRRVDRHKRHRHQPRPSLSDDSDPDEDGDEDEDEEGEGEGLADRTLKAEVSFVAESLAERVQRLGRELDGKVQLIKEGLEDLSTSEGGEGEVDNWHMLSFALQDWRPSLHS